MQPPPFEGKNMGLKKPKQNHLTSIILVSVCIQFLWHKIPSTKKKNSNTQNSSKPSLFHEASFGWEFFSFFFSPFFLFYTCP